MTERDELLLATMHARDQQLADLIVLCIGLAAERHPELLKTALAKVFDLKALIEANESASRHVKRTFELANEATELVRALMLDLDQVEKRMDALKADREKLIAQFTKIVTLMQKAKEPKNGASQTGA